MNKQQLYNKLPHLLKNVLVTLYNLRQVKSHGKLYKQYIEMYKTHFFHTSYDQLKAIQNERFLSLIKFVRNNNPYYQQKLKGIKINSIEDRFKIPELSKEDLRLDSIKSNVDQSLVKGNTGGTTGKSLHFAITQDNFSERMACLDFFRGMYGYNYGDEIAWFSGKEIITDREVQQNIFWVRDYRTNVTYYSTFHLKPDYIQYMIQDIRHKHPRYLAGFPSAITDIARQWEKSGIEPIQLNAIFPTSEPLLTQDKEFLQAFFNCPVPDQYASSEGAPFIYECPQGSLHYDMLSGIFDVKDETLSGPVLVTSFTTDYMPLIRYDIGDSIVFPEQEITCSCGSNMPVVEKIIGRSTSFIYSSERGKVTNSNISNVIKYLNGIEKFQVVQKQRDSIEVYIVYSGENKTEIQKKIEYELRYRLGEDMNIHYHFVASIPPGNNGKFQMVINQLKPEEFE